MPVNRFTALELQSLVEAALPVSEREAALWALALNTALLHPEAIGAHTIRGLHGLAQAAGSQFSNEGPLSQPADFLLQLLRLVLPLPEKRGEALALAVRRFGDVEEFTRRLVNAGQPALADSIPIGFDIERVSDDLIAFFFNFMHENDQTSFGTVFLGRHLEAFIEHQKFMRDHVTLLVTEMTNPETETWHSTAAYQFLARHLDLFIDKGLFDSRHVESMLQAADRGLVIIAGVKHHAALKFFLDFLPHLIDRKIFGETEMDLALSLAFPHPPQFSEDPQTADFKFRGALTLFLVNSIELLIERGLFGRPQLARVLEVLSEPGCSPSASSLCLELIGHGLPRLLNGGLFHAEDAVVIRKALVKNPREFQFYDKHFPLLQANGFFSGEDYDLIRARLIDGHDDALTFVGKHWEALQKYGLNDRDIGAWAFHAPDTFINQFPALAATGLLTNETLSAFFLAAGMKKTLPAPVRKALTGMAWPNYLATSHMRWKKLVSLFAKRDETVDALLALAVEKNTPHDYASFLLVLADMDQKEAADLLYTWQKLYEYRIGEVRRLFYDLAWRLNVSAGPHSHFLRRLQTPEMANLLYDWYLSGMLQTWWDYHARLNTSTIQPAGTKGALKKHFLNFIERESGRTPPTVARLMAREGGRIIDFSFQRRLLMEEDLQPSFWKQFKSSRLYGYLAKAIRFQDPAGVASIRKLIQGLRMKEVSVLVQYSQREGPAREEIKKERRLAYPRYEELQGVVTDPFLTEWKIEYEFELFGRLGPIGEANARRILKDQVIRQVELHWESRGSAKEALEIQNLVPRVDEWMSKYKASGELEGDFLEEARKIHRIFEAHFSEIIEHISPVFANIRYDLRSFIHGMDRGVKIARRSERMTVTGDITAVGASGSVPTDTCQSLEFAWGANTDGKPVNRMIHGQIKVANWVIDGEIVARRILEMTVDKEGREHLLVERHFTAGGFARDAEFKAVLVRYAEKLGLNRAHVHFGGELDFKGGLPPPALTNEDPMYMENFRQGNYSLKIVRMLRERGWPGDQADLYFRVQVIEKNGVKTAEYASADLIRATDEALLRAEGFHLIRTKPVPKADKLLPLRRMGFSVVPGVVGWEMRVPESLSEYKEALGPEPARVFQEKMDLAARYRMEAAPLTDGDFRKWFAIYSSQAGYHRSMTADWFEQLMSGDPLFKEGALELHRLFFFDKNTNAFIGGILFLKNDSGQGLIVSYTAFSGESGLTQSNMLPGILYAARQGFDADILRTFYRDNFFADPETQDLAAEMLAGLFKPVVASEGGFKAVKVLDAAPFQRQPLFFNVGPEGKLQATVINQKSLPDRDLFSALMEARLGIAFTNPHLLDSIALISRVKFVNEYGISVAEYESPQLWHPDDEAALRMAGIDLIRIRGFSEGKGMGNWREKGFSVKPVKMWWMMETPKKDDAYFEHFSGRHGNTLKKRLKKSEGFAVETGEMTQKEFDEWFPLYSRAMTAMPRGQMKIGEDWYVKILEAKKSRKKIFVRDSASGKLIGGAVLWDEGDHISISYIGADQALRAKEIDARILFELQRYARLLGKARVGYGTDLNLFGHHEEAGLFRRKQYFGYKPNGYGPSGREAMKILNTRPFLENTLFLEESGDFQAPTHIVLMEGHTFTPAEVESIARESGFPVKISPPCKLKDLGGDTGEGEDPAQEAAAFEDAQAIARHFMYNSQVMGEPPDEERPPIRVAQLEEPHSLPPLPVSHRGPERLRPGGMPMIGEPRLAPGATLLAADPLFEMDEPRSHDESDFRRRGALSPRHAQTLWGPRPQNCSGRGIVNLGSRARVF